jgi:steroid 5-alpha reductase family enzyme
MELLKFSLAGFGTLLALFTVAWLIQLRTRNGAIADVFWAVGFPLVTIVYFLIEGNFELRQIILVILVSVWGIRLGLYLFFRTIGKPEDGRYTALREEWGAKQNFMMLRFYYFQAILAFLLSFQFLVIIRNGGSSITFVEIIGFMLWAIGVIGETVADAQLQRFKSNAANKGKVCDQGLWYYSRHPNYFFEWLVWVSYFVMALHAPWGIYTILCPLAMLYFLTKVTGIVYTEAQMEKSKGAAFLRYKKTTSAFLPLPKQKN